MQKRWDYTLVLEHLPSMQEGLDSMPSAEDKEIQQTHSLQISVLSSCTSFLQPETTIPHLDPGFSRHSLHTHTHFQLSSQVLHIPDYLLPWDLLMTGGPGLDRDTQR